MKKPTKNCPIYWLTQWGHLTHEQSEALYLAAEVLSSGNPPIILYQTCA